jgi:CBS-domain-containing membrane protein
LFPVIDADRLVLGVVSRNHLSKLFEEAQPLASATPLREIMVKEPTTAYADEPLRLVVYRMVETGFRRMPVIDSDEGRLLGMVSLDDLLSARSRSLEEERARERVLRLRMPIGQRKSNASSEIVAVSEEAEIKIPSENLK